MRLRARFGDRAVICPQRDAAVRTPHMSTLTFCTPLKIWELLALVHWESVSLSRECCVLVGGNGGTDLLADGNDCKGLLSDNFSQRSVARTHPCTTKADVLPQQHVRMSIRHDLSDETFERTTDSDVTPAAECHTLPVRASRPCSMHYKSRQIPS